MTEAIKNKLTMPSDIVEETRVARERGSTGRTVVEVTVEDTKPSKVATTLKASDRMTDPTFNEIEVEDTKPGKVAATLKASDQMTGQTFNDVGRMDY